MADTDGGERMAGRRRRANGRRRVTAAAGALLALGLITACSNTDTARPDSPGTNLSVDDIKIRYAHLEDPAETDVYQAGSSVPLYMWLLNEGSTATSLQSVSSPIAESVSYTGGSLPLPLPPGQLVQLGPRGGGHFVLQNIGQQLRAAEFVPVQVTFGDGTRVGFEVEAVAISPTPSGS